MRVMWRVDEQRADGRDWVVLCITTASMALGGLWGDGTVTA